MPPITLRAKTLQFHFCFHFSDDDGPVSDHERVNAESEDEEWKASSYHRDRVAPKRPPHKNLGFPPKPKPFKPSKSVQQIKQQFMRPKQQFMLPVADDEGDSDVESVISEGQIPTSKAKVASVCDVIVSSSDNDVIETDQEEAVEVEVDLPPGLPGLGGGGMLPLPPSMRAPPPTSSSAGNPAKSAFDAYQQYVNSLPAQGPQTTTDPDAPVEEITLDD